jgi:predicted DNA-binding transcriptional regulator YafY
MSQLRNKQRLLRMLKYLYQNTDENHPVTTNELVDIFTDANANATRKTVKDDIDVLVNEGYDIVKIRSYYNAFFMASREFELPELKLLIDAVSSSRFITKEKSDTLIKKLTGLTSKYEAEKLVRHLYTAGRMKQDNSGIYYIVDRINDAINEEKKITFQYYDYTTEKEKVLRHEGETYVVSPYSLLWDDNHYYMIGYLDKRSAVNVFRVDRITNLEISEDAAIPQPGDFNLDEFARTVFDMYAGEEQEVVLECRNEVMKSVIDHFTDEVEAWEVSQMHFRVKAVVSTSPTFYGWLFQFAGKMRPISPETVVDEYRDMLKKALMHLSL